MAKLRYNYEQLQSIVINSLIQTQDNLSSAIKTSNSMDIPGGFSYAGILTSMGPFLSSKQNEYSNMQLKIEKSNKDYNIVERDLSDSIVNLNKCDIKDRESIIIK